jgi:hypothetical protein
MIDVELKPGVETSEYALTKYVFIAGTVVTLAGVVLESLAAMGIGHAYVGTALAAVGILAKLLQAAGYQSKRTALKTEAISSVNYQNGLRAEQIRTLPDAIAALNESLAAMEAEKAGREAVEMATDLSKVG